VQATVFAGRTHRPPAEGTADAVRAAGRGAAGYDTLADEYIGILQNFCIAFRAFAHVQFVHAYVDEFLGHQPDLSQAGRILGERHVVPGEPADEQTARAEAELYGHGLVARIQDG
jgi:hypothetical protein